MWRFAPLCFVLTVLVSMVLWSLDSNYMNKFYASFRKCIRKIWGVPPRTHCRLLKHLYDSPGIDYELMSRFLTFYQSVCVSENKCTRLCSLLCKSTRTAVAKNRRLLLFKLGIPQLFVGSCNKVMLSEKYKCGDVCMAEGAFLRELCLVRDGAFSTELEREDILELIELVGVG